MHNFPKYAPAEFPCKRRKILFSFLSVHALTSASLSRPPVSSARWWGWDPPQEEAAAAEGPLGGRPEASAATEVVAKRGRWRRNTIGRHWPPARGATTLTFLQFSKRRNFAQSEQLCTAKFLCQRLVWSKRIIAVLFTSLFSCENLYNVISEGKRVNFVTSLNGLNNKYCSRPTSSIPTSRSSALTSNLKMIP